MLASIWSSTSVRSAVPALLLVLHAANADARRPARASASVPGTSPQGTTPSTGPDGTAPTESERLIMPSGQVALGANLAFMTSEPHLTETELQLTDLALLGLSLRRSFADWLELSLGGTLLPKQPAEVDADVAQRGYFNIVVEPTPGFGVGVGNHVGQLLVPGGVFWQADPTLIWKPVAEDKLRFRVELGVNSLMLRAPQLEAYWLTELDSAVELRLGRRPAALWARVDYHVPVSSKSGAGWAPDGLQPQARLDLQLGGSITFDEQWDVWASYSLLDRGELTDPGTTLPILEGGFDQRLLTIGLEYRFERPEPPARQVWVTVPPSHPIDPPCQRGRGWPGAGCGPYRH